MANPEVPLQPAPEHATSLLVSVETQRALLEPLITTLTSYTLNERNGYFHDNTEAIAQIDIIRKFTTNLAKNLGEAIPPKVALYAGLIDLLTDEHLREAAEVGDPTATFLMHKKTASEKQSPTEPSF